MPPEKKSREQTEIDSIMSPSASPFGQTPKKEYIANPELKSLRTYQGDMEETIHTKNESVISVAVAEQKAKANEQKKPAFEETKEGTGSIFMTHGLMPLVGLILFVTGIITLGGIYYYFHILRAPIPVVLQNTLISYTTKYNITIQSGNEREQLVQAFANEIKNWNGTMGSVLYITNSENGKSLSSTDFFQIIAPSAPGTFIRSLDSNYMVGLYAFDQNEPFITLTSSDYGQTYASMLSWENTMQSDFSDFFPDLKASTFASSSPLWKDETFNNHDVRVLRNENDSIVLLYGFLDKQTVVITANEKVFEALVNKYINSKLVR